MFRCRIIFCWKKRKHFFLAKERTKIEYKFEKKTLQTMAASELSVIDKSNKAEEILDKASSADTEEKGESSSRYVILFGKKYPVRGTRRQSSLSENACCSNLGRAVSNNHSVCVDQFLENGSRCEHRVQRWASIGYCS